MFKKTERQLALPFMQSSDPCPRARSVDECIWTEKKTLRALHLRTSWIYLVLQNPEEYWDRITVSRSGEERECFSPRLLLRKIHDRIGRHVRNQYREKQRLFQPNASTYYVATAFRQGDSIVKNAQCHYGNQSSLVLDLESAFTSIRTKHIYRCFLRFMPKTRAWLFSRLLTYQGRLTQGSPVSPTIFNILMDRFDRAILEAIGATRYPISIYRYRERRKKRFDPFSDVFSFLDWRPDKERRLTYTRYGDDLCFSSPLPEFPEEVEKKVREVVATFNLRLNRKRKTGKHGILELPGVRIVKGRIQPDHRSIKRYAKAVSTEAPQEVLHGYHAFFRQFPRNGRRRAYKIAAGQFQTS